MNDETVAHSSDSKPAERRSAVALVVTCRNTAPVLDLCLRSHELFSGDRVRYVIADTSDDASGAQDVFEAFRARRGELDGTYVDLRGQRSLYSRTCHLAAERCVDAEWIVFANDDTVATPGWLETMLDDFERIEAAGFRLGLLGARSNRVSGPQRATPGDPDAPFACPRTVTFFAMVRRDRYFTVGGFDLDLPANNFSDDALSVRLLEHGFTNWCSRAFVPHFGSLSFQAAQVDYGKDLEAGATFMRRTYATWPRIFDAPYRPRAATRSTEVETC